MTPTMCVAVQLEVLIGVLTPDPSATVRSVRDPNLFYLRAFSADLGARSQHGSHLILYGPRGSGKSTLLAAMLDDYHRRAIPCALAAQTSGLMDIVAALSQAYPEVEIEGLHRRAARARLRRTADRCAGVLLLDHTCEVTTAMIGFLRRLRGGIVGTLLVVDIDSEFERERLRSWRRHALCVRMPLLASRRMRRLLLSQCSDYRLPRLNATMVRQIVRAARGRVGWLTDCVRRLRMPEYWDGGRLHVGGLCTDTEIAIREGGRGPHMSRRSIRAQIGV
jgi:energy-coupling factor transporter ATP-binding protein EcfA2